MTAKEALTPELEAVVAACGTLRAGRDAEQAARAARDAALVRWWRESGVPQRQAARRAREALAGRGWSEEQIAQVGLGDANVIAVLRSARRGGREDRPQVK